MPPVKTPDVKDLYGIRTNTQVSEELVISANRKADVKMLNDIDQPTLQGAERHQPINTQDVKGLADFSQSTFRKILCPTAGTIADWTDALV